MKLPLILQDEIYEFFLSLPNIHDTNSQRTLIYQAGLDSQLENQLPFGLPTAQFVSLLVATLIDYGKNRDGRYALESVLESVKRSVGQDKQVHCDNLIERLREAFIAFDLISPYHDNILDFTHYIQEKTHHFIGREWVFDKIYQFINNNSRGYFFVKGDPGIGKTALIADLIKHNDYVHHFNIRAEGINTVGRFLKNVAAQLIEKYRLPYSEFSPQAMNDSNIFSKLLGQISQCLKDSEKNIILIDALDEVIFSEPSIGANPLFLPLTVPEGTYIVITMRRSTEIFRAECEFDELYIDQDSPSNLEDLRLYLQQIVKRKNIQKYITIQKIHAVDFVEQLIEKSQGNFMYLRHVIPEMECGAYQKLELSSIPKGLENYYEDHWSRIQTISKDSWFDYKLPILMALTVIHEPISVDLICEFSGVKQRSIVRTVLKEWTQFLYEEEILYHQKLQKRYRLYHSSFIDFVAGKEEIADERFEARQKIADIMTKSMWGN